MLNAADSIISALLAVLSVAIFVATRSYPAPLVPGTPGAALFPRILAAILFGLAALLFVQSRTTGKEDRPRTSWRAGGRPVCALVMMIVFLILLEHLGTFVLLPILLSGIMLLMGERRIQTIVAVSIGFDVFVYVVFYRIFHVMLPTVFF